MKRLLKRFVQEFGTRENVRAFFAPGRVNLIGEHTDYNGGLVLPVACQFGTFVLISPRQDGMFQLVSTNFSNKVSFQVDQLTYSVKDGWGNYPKGVIQSLLDHLNPENKYQLSKGADILYQGDMPIGAGLSSSASIGVVTAFALTQMVSCLVSRIKLAQIVQQAENQFIGVNCGIMDPFVIGMGKSNQAIMLRCSTLDYKYIPFNCNEVKLIITNTKKDRNLIQSDYNQRKEECEKGLKITQNEIPELSTLGEMSNQTWKKIQSNIPSDTIRRRVEHVVSENERVLLATNYLKKNDLSHFGKLMVESHKSLRDNYEVTGIEQDTIFEEAMNIDGCLGSRMTGAGFGGCHISLVRNEVVNTFKDKVSKGYMSKFGVEPDFYCCLVEDGVREIFIHF